MTRQHASIPSVFCLAMSMAIVACGRKQEKTDPPKSDVAQEAEAPTYKRVGELKISAWSYGSAISHDGSRVATYSKSKLELWDVATSKLLCPLHVEHEIGYASSLCFSQDGARVLASMSTSEHAWWDRSYYVRIFDTATGKPVRDFPHRYPLGRAAFSADGKHIIAAAGADYPRRLDPTGVWVEAKREGMAVLVWNVDTGKSVRVFPHDERIREVALSADGATAYFCSYNSLIRCDVATGKRIGAIDMTRSHYVEQGLRFTANGKALVPKTENALLRGGWLRLWDLANPKPIRELTLDVLDDPKKELEGDVYSQFGEPEVSADGKIALVYISIIRHTVEPRPDKADKHSKRTIDQFKGAGGKAYLWDTENDKIVLTFPPPEKRDPTPGISFSGLRLSGDGRTVLLGHEVWKRLP